MHLALTVVSERELWGTTSLLSSEGHSGPAHTSPRLRNQTKGGGIPLQQLARGSYGAS